MLLIIVSNLIQKPNPDCMFDWLESTGNITMLDEFPYLQVENILKGMELISEVKTQAHCPFCW